MYETAMPEIPGSISGKTEKFFELLSEGNGKPPRVSLPSTLL